MPIITSLKPQRNKKFVNVSVDGKFSFGIDLDNLYKYKLAVEKEYTLEELDEINRSANFAKTLNKFLSFAMSRPHSNRELVNWLNRKLVEKSQHSKLFEKLQNFGLVDDEKFATWWVEQRLHFKQKSKKALQFELKQKGIKDSIIAKVLGEANIDEFELAKKQAEKKLRSLGRFDEETKKKKLADFLMRKGFGWDLIKKVLGAKID